VIGASESKTAGITANETVRSHWHALLFNESEELLVGGNLNYSIMTSDRPESQICDSAVLSKHHESAWALLMPTSGESESCDRESSCQPTQQH
jgi:hypothetical protein